MSNPISFNELYINIKFFQDLIYPINIDISEQATLTSEILIYFLDR